jgi:ribonuclease D
MIGLVTENPNVIKNIKNRHEEVVIATKEMALQFLETLDWIGFDAETLGFDPYTSDLITIQMGNDKHQFVVDVKSVDIDYFKDLLESKPLIGHNLKFDLRFLYHYRIIPYKVYDTFIAEKTTRLGIKTHRSSLADTVKRHCNVMLDKSVRASIDGSFNIPFVIYSALDVKYLHKIKEKQLELLEEAESLNSIELDNRFVKVLAYIEYCGFKLDGQKWQEKTNNTKKEMEEAKSKLDEYILDNEMSDFINYQTDLFSDGLKTKINWNSPQSSSTIL